MIWVALAGTLLLFAYPIGKVVNWLRRIHTVRRETEIAFDQLSRRLRNRTSDV